MKSVVVCALLAIVSFTLVAIYDRGPLVGDDLTHIRDASYLAELPSLRDIDVRKAVDWTYRPLVSLTYYAQKKVGLEEPVEYRLINVFIHFLNACLLLGIVRKTLRRRELSPLVAIPIVGFFAFHPVAWHSVVYASARSTLLVSTFILTAILIFAATWRVALTASLAVLACMVKETGLLTIPLVVFGNIETMIESVRPAEKSRRLALRVLLVAIATGVWLKFWPLANLVMGHPLARPHVWSNYVLSQIDAIYLYLGLMTYNSFGWDFYHFIDLPELDQWPVYLAKAVGLIVIVGTTLLFLRRKRSIAGFVICIVVAFLPEFFIPRELLSAEQRVYLPLAFFSVALAIYSTLQPSKILFGVFSVMTILNVGLTCQRIVESASFEGLLRRAIARDPRNTVAAGYLATIRAEVEPREAEAWAMTVSEWYGEKIEMSRWFWGERDKTYYVGFVAATRHRSLDYVRDLAERCPRPNLERPFCEFAKAYYLLLAERPEEAKAVLDETDPADLVGHNLMETAVEMITRKKPN